MSRDHRNHHNSPAASTAATAGDWQFGNPSMSMSMAIPNSTIPIYQGIQMVSSSCPQVSVAADSFYPNPWSHPPGSQTSGFPENATAAAANNLPIAKPLSLPPRLDMGMFLPTNPGILPPSLSDFPTDSSFIERVAKFSSFSAGNFSALVNPFGSSESLSPYSNASKSISGAQTPKNEVGKDVSMSIDHGSRCQSSMNNHRDNGSGREDTSDMANVSGDSSLKGLNSKKRKKGSQDMELDEVQEGSQFSAEIPKENVETKQNVECSSPSLATGKSSEKNAKGSTDGAKQDYIHVRARRGQATNSHSLAERVRRERISERMKYLQDLVPGCSKVTGKAVMLDEIINYVQSLQRQVEFLSMKLAAVNPSIDLNIEGLLSKDILPPRVGPSPVGFSPDLIHPHLLPSQQGLASTGIPGMVNHADTLRRAVNAQFTAINGFKEPTPQMSNPWEAELQNMVQMNFGTNSTPNTQEHNGKSHEGFPL